ncbi:hypothetical protein AMECASPLE_021652 [Ameca splendens]|uniref:Uncharacterized protein n=1 Tax=Ameca splendens TaxID=208324 RepID=A0ABV1AAV1_9TELE
MCCKICEVYWQFQYFPGKRASFQTSLPQTPPFLTLFPVSPDSPLLDFTDNMKNLVKIRIQLTLCPNLTLSPQNPQHQCSETLTLIESMPLSYNFPSEIMERRRSGGVATLFHDSLKYKKVFLGKFDSFEYLAVQAKGPAQALFMNVYRPLKIISMTSL